VQSNLTSCRSFHESAEVIGKIAFKMFLGVAARVTDWSEDGTAVSLQLPAKDNPLTDFVELPEKYRDLSYSSILCGVLRGALEMVRWPL
jgi:trafficking protein particle complex subunit 3